MSDRDHVTDYRGYVSALKTAGLVRTVTALDAGSIGAAIDAALARPMAETAAARDAHVATCPDWAGAVVQAIDRHALR